MIGCIRYSGIQEYGHYVAYRKKDKDWYRLSDDHITKASPFVQQHQGCFIKMALYKLKDQLPK